MAVPKKKTSLHKRKLRRGAHSHQVKLLAHSVCTNCKADTIPHNVCMSCGFYKGRKFLDIK